jgi:hypothetical protein
MRTAGEFTLEGPARVAKPAATRPGGRPDPQQDAATVQPTRVWTAQPDGPPPRTGPTARLTFRSGSGVVAVTSPVRWSRRCSRPVRSGSLSGSPIPDRTQTAPASTASPCGKPATRRARAGPPTNGTRHSRPPSSGRVQTASVPTASAPTGWRRLAVSVTNSGGRARSVRASTLPNSHHLVPAPAAIRPQHRQGGHPFPPWPWSPGARRRRLPPSSGPAGDRPRSEQPASPPRRKRAASCALMRSRRLPGHPCDPSADSLPCLGRVCNVDGTAWHVRIGVAVGAAGWLDFLARFRVAPRRRCPCPTGACRSVRSSSSPDDLTTKPAPSARAIVALASGRRRGRASLTCVGSVTVGS